MKLPKVEKFLFCFDLKNGCLFLGHFYAIITGLAGLKTLIDIIFDKPELKKNLMKEIRGVEKISPASDWVGNSTQLNEEEQEKLPMFGETFF